MKDYGPVPDADSIPFDDLILGTRYRVHRRHSKPLEALYTEMVVRCSECKPGPLQLVFIRPGMTYVLDRIHIRKIECIS